MGGGGKKAVRTGKARQSRRDDVEEEAKHQSNTGEDEVRSEQKGALGRKWRMPKNLQASYDRKTARTRYVSETRAHSSPHHELMT